MSRSRCHPQKAEDVFVSGPAPVRMRLSEFSLGKIPALKTYIWLFNRNIFALPAANHFPFS